MNTITLPEAARHLGTSIRELRGAMRAGRIAGPPHLTATTSFSPEWLASAKSALEAHPDALGRKRRQKVPAYARYQGTSAWQKFPRRVRAYAKWRDAQAQ